MREGGSGGQFAGRSDSLGVTNITAICCLYTLPLVLDTIQRSPGRSCSESLGGATNSGDLSCRHPKGKQRPRNVQFGHLFRPDAFEGVFCLFLSLRFLSYCLSSEQHYYEMKLLLCTEKEKQLCWCLRPFKNRGVGTSPSLRNEFPVDFPGIAGGFGNEETALSCSTGEQASFSVL